MDWTRRVKKCQVVLLRHYPCTVVFLVHCPVHCILAVGHFVFSHPHLLRWTIQTLGSHACYNVHVIQIYLQPLVGIDGWAPDPFVTSRHRLHIESTQVSAIWAVQFRWGYDVNFMSEDAVAFNSEGRTAFWGPVGFVSFLVTFKITATTTTTTTATKTKYERQTRQLLWVCCIDTPLTQVHRVFLSHLFDSFFKVQQTNLAEPPKRLRRDHNCSCYSTPSHTRGNHCCLHSEKQKTDRKVDRRMKRQTDRWIDRSVLTSTHEAMLL